MKPFVMTYLSVRQISGAARGGVLGYKYFLETGQAASSPAEINRYAASADAHPVPSGRRPSSAPAPEPGLSA